MLMCEFLTAVQHKLPVKVVVYNNSAFGLITLEAEHLGLPPFRKAIEFPNPDFVALARACGGHGFKASQPGELKAAISEAFAVDGPAIVDAVVVPNEFPEYSAFRSGNHRKLRQGEDEGSDYRGNRLMMLPIDLAAEFNNSPCSVRPLGVLGRLIPRRQAARGRLDCRGSKRQRRESHVHVPDDDATFRALVLVPILLGLWRQLPQDGARLRHSVPDRGSPTRKH